MTKDNLKVLHTDISKTINEKLKSLLDDYYRATGVQVDTVNVYWDETTQVSTLEINCVRVFL